MHDFVSCLSVALFLAAALLAMQGRPRHRHLPLSHRIAGTGPTRSNPLSSESRRFRGPGHPLILVAILLSRSAAAAAPDLPMPATYVVDRAGVIDAPHEQSLNGILQELEQKTGVQYIILTVDSTGGLPIEQFSIELVEKWRLGQADKDDGFLFTLARKDRAYRFEAGDGLEGVVPDQWLGRIGRDVLEPNLAQGRIDQGIYDANLRVIQRIAQDAGVTLTGMPALPREANYGPMPPAQRGVPFCGCPCCGLLLILLIVMLLFGGGRRGRGFGWGWLFFLPLLFRGFGGLGGHGRSGSFGGGPFGGGFGGFGGGMRGGFGRFGGGGGGRFSGGGASGHW